MCSLIAIGLAAKPKSEKYSFGWHRAEVLGAVASVVAIWIVTTVLATLAVDKIKYGDYDEINPMTMLITSGVGVAVNIPMAVMFHGHGHTHGHTHGAERGEAQRRENINVKAAFIHVVGDFFQSIGKHTHLFVKLNSKDLQLKTIKSWGHPPQLKFIENGE